MKTVLFFASLLFMPAAHASSGDVLLTCATQIDGVMKVVQWDAPQIGGERAFAQTMLIDGQAFRLAPSVSDAGQTTVSIDDGIAPKGDQDGPIRNLRLQPSWGSGNTVAFKADSGRDVALTCYFMHE